MCQGVWCADRLILPPRFPLPAALGAQDVRSANMIAREMVLSQGFGNRMGLVDMMHVTSTAQDTGSMLRSADSATQDAQYFHHVDKLTTEQVGASGWGRVGTGKANGDSIMWISLRRSRQGRKGEEGGGKGGEGRCGKGEEGRGRGVPPCGQAHNGTAREVGVLAPLSIATAAVFDLLLPPPPLLCRRGLPWQTSLSSWRRVRPRRAMAWPSTGSHSRRWWRRSSSTAYCRAQR